MEVNFSFGSPGVASQPLRQLSAPQSPSCFPLFLISSFSSSWFEGLGLALRAGLRPWRYKNYDVFKRADELKLKRRETIAERSE
jgi:hypothetical protein